MSLAVKNLQLAYGTTVVISDLTLEIAAGRVVSLVGRNGSGKSTLLRSMGRLITPRSGAVLLDGKEIQRIPPRDLARQLAILPQGPTAPDGMTVLDLVETGRYPHRRMFGVKSDEDHEKVQWALRQTGLVDLVDRPLEFLSGGQRQRAWIAMALAQDTGVILLDEPTTFLDVAYQLELMELLRRLNQDHGTTILMVLHDLNQAAAYSDELVAIREGDVYAHGEPHEVLTAEMVRDVFGLEADVVVDARSGSPMCIPYALAAPDDDPETAAAPNEVMAS